MNPGARTETEALFAAAEVDEEGLLTGGPHTADEWADWNEKFDRGQIGRFVMKGSEP